MLFTGCVFKHGFSLSLFFLSKSLSVPSSYVASPLSLALSLSLFFPQKEKNTETKRKICGHWKKPKEDRTKKETTKKRVSRHILARSAVVALFDNPYRSDDQRKQKKAILLLPPPSFFFWCGDTQGNGIKNKRKSLYYPLKNKSGDTPHFPHSILFTRMDERRHGKYKIRKLGNTKEGGEGRRQQRKNQNVTAKTNGQGRTYTQQGWM